MYFWIGTFIWRILSKRQLYFLENFFLFLTAKVINCMVLLFEGVVLGKTFSLINLRILVFMTQYPSNLFCWKSSLIQRFFYTYILNSTLNQRSKVIQSQGGWRTLAYAVLWAASVPRRVAFWDDTLAYAVLSAASVGKTGEELEGERKINSTIKVLYFPLFFSLRFSLQYTEIKVL